MIYNSISQLEDVLRHLKHNLHLKHNRRLKHKFVQKDTEYEVVAQYHNEVAEYLSRDHDAFKAEYQKVYDKAMRYYAENGSFAVKGAQEALNELLKAYNSDLELFEHILLTQVDTIYAKVKYSCAIIPDDKFQSKVLSLFWKIIFDQSNVKHLTYSNALPLFSLGEQKQFLRLVHLAIQDVNISGDQLVKTLSELYTYSAKHNHSSAKITGVGYRPVAPAGHSTLATPMFNTIQNPGMLVYTGTVGGGTLNSYTALATIMPYVVRISHSTDLADTQLSTLELVKRPAAYFEGLGLNEEVLATFKPLQPAGEVEENLPLGVKSSSSKAAFITIAGKQCTVIPSNLLLEQLSVLRDSCRGQTKAYEAVLNDYITLAKDQKKTDSAKMAEEDEETPKVDHARVSAPFTNSSIINPAAGALQLNNISVMYSDLFSGGIPRFRAFVPMQESSKESKSAYRFLKYGYENLCKNLKDTVEQKLISHRMLQGFNTNAHLLNNKDRARLSESVESIVAGEMRAVIRKMVHSQKDVEVRKEIARKRVTFHGHKVLRDLVLGDAISSEEAISFAKTLINTTLQDLTLTNEQKSQIATLVATKLKEDFNV